MIFCAALSAFFTHPGFFSAIGRFVLWSLMLEYAYLVLRTTALGRFQPPPLHEKILATDLPIVFKQITLFFVLFLLLYWLTAGGPILLVAVLTAIALLLPAMLIILVIRDDLGQALNPVSIFSVIRHMGENYFLLLCFLLLSAVPVVFGYTAIRYAPNWLQVFIISAAGNYCTLVAYHLMGYVILQFHNQLDYPLEMDKVLESVRPSAQPADNSGRTSSKAPQDEELINAAGLLASEGNWKEGLQYIEMHVAVSQIYSPELSELYIGLLRMQKDHRKFLSYASHHMELLAKCGLKSKAVELYLECIRLDKGFVPQALVLFKIAGWLNEGGQNREAVYALNCLIKAYPQHTMVPKALYRAAQIYYERLKEIERSQKILTELIQKFPDHEIAATARSYLGRLLRRRRGVERILQKSNSRH